MHGLTRNGRHAHCICHCAGDAEQRAAASAIDGTDGSWTLPALLGESTQGAEPLHALCALEPLPADCTAAVADGQRADAATDTVSLDCLE
eukprot:COSAG01_NODE_41215_length_454_cov_1.014085_1_plen_89_part_10